MDFFKNLFKRKQTEDDRSGCYSKEDFYSYQDDFPHYSENSIHEIFEQQFAEVMKSFKHVNTLFEDSNSFKETSPHMEQGSDIFLRIDDFFRGFGNMLMGPSEPMIMDRPPDKPPEKKNLRDYYLKPTYESSKEKVDKDLDGDFVAKDLDVLSPSYSSDVTKRSSAPFGFKSIFGQSFSSQTSTNKDGWVETVIKKRSLDGNEEITIVKKRGDSEYTKVIKIDKDGRREEFENSINMDNIP